MSENKQNEVLTGYEQLKRRNRRRLVTASSLVAASCILLAAALSSDPADSNPAPQAKPAQRKAKRQTRHKPLP